MENMTNGRCGWCGDDALYCAYHDNEWGRLVTDERKLFEFLILESAQAGLSWITILRRREGYRDAFLEFDVKRVASMTDDDVERLMKHEGIIRNRRKIQSVISNAMHFIEVQREFGSFYNYICSFLADGQPIVNHPKTLAAIPATSSLSDAIAKDMKRRGFSFFGSTICYAFLQAAGFVNDHLDDCKFKFQL